MLARSARHQAGFRQRPPLAAPRRGVALVLNHHRFHHQRHVVAQRAGDRGRRFDRARVALVRHGGGPYLALAERLGEFIDLVVLERQYFVCDLSQRRPQHPEHARVFGEAVTRRVPRNVGDSQSKPPHYAAVEFHRLRTVGRLGADRTHQAAHEHARFALPQTLVMAPHLGEPDRAFVAESDGQRLHAVRAADHGGSAVRFRQPV